MKILFITITILVLLFPNDDPYLNKRIRMVRMQIENRGIDHKSTLDAMLKVPRHLFVPEKLKDEAYDDNPIPIGFGQTISQPYIVAYMTAAIEPRTHHKILEIGTGSGYQAAILAEIVKEVYTIEIVEELFSSAKKRIESLGYKNIKLKYADGYYGWQEAAPFDVIVVTAAAEYIPPPLLEQLKDGGKMIIPIGTPFLNQNLVLVEKSGKDFTTKSLLPVRFVPFTRKK
ncbi:MAG TPA: protein-L-isoaspartate(D-aspartate) O-methyltransferase [Ignavibacteriaceae bacterium]